MKHLLTLGALATAALLACAPAHAAANQQAGAKPAAVSADSKRLNDLADAYWDAEARFNPIMAGEAGDSRFNDQIGMAISPKVRAQQFALYKDYARRLHAVRRSALSPRDQTTYDILDYDLKTALRFEAFPEHLLPLDQMDSVPVDLANYASGQGAQPLVTVKDYQAYLSRLEQLGPWIDQAIVNMREGVKRGVTLPKAIVVSMLPQFKQLTYGSVESSIYWTPVKQFPAGFSDADKQKLTADYRRVLDKLRQPVAALSTFLDTEYLPACRTSTGYDALPNGKAWYLARVASQTTTSLSPDEIHLTGLKEVARIQKEYARIGPQMGFGGPATDLPTWVGEQAKYKPFKTEGEIIAVYRKLNATLNTKLPALFSLRPKTPLDIRLEPELTRATASDHYTPPAVDGSRPGVFWAVVNDPKQYGSTGMTTLFLHEGQPGHHFHIALSQELGLPTLRKFDMNNAFTEGWALYAETLGSEMGLYEKPEDWFGHLNDEMLRAVRLVVDTGMHSKGWTREQSIKYMRETLGYTEALARSETERYMAWPGQALGYKIGALKIQALRARAEQALGPKFNLPAFHAVVLGEGTLPLELLEKKVNLWIAATKARK
jgi:uncharacterized protein (DUF885 family)